MTASVQHRTGTIGPKDMHTHVLQPFVVPADTTRIEVAFDYQPKAPPGSAHTHEISLSLDDPVTGRGARHANPDHRIVLENGHASFGYVPGPILPGTWTVSIDVHRIIAPGSVTYDLTITTDNAPARESAEHFAPAACAPRGPGWYRGDLHGHSLHSDADWDVPAFIAYARGLGLDFVTLTDHNTPSGLPEALSLAGDDLLVMGGTELTTFWGHCLSLGCHDHIPWRQSTQRRMADIARAEIARGALFAIAHPAHVGNPWCSGCDWRYGDLMPGPAPAVEVWNAGWIGRSNNETALRLYYSWLNAGHRLVATAGSDIHRPLRPDKRIGYNVVHAAALSEADILAAIGRGHLYLSSGPVLTLTAQTVGAEAMMGDQLSCGEVTLTATWQHAPGDARIRLTHRSQDPDAPCAITEIGQGAIGSAKQTFAPQDAFDWVAVEVRDGNGELHGLTNPIFFNQEA